MQIRTTQGQGNLYSYAVYFYGNTLALPCLSI